MIVDYGTLVENVGREIDGDDDAGAERPADALRATQAILAGSGVGVAGVHHERPHAAARREVRACEHHRGRAEPVAREHARNPAPRGETHDEQV